MRRKQFLRYNASKIKNNWDWTFAFANGQPNGADEPTLDGWQNPALFSEGNIQISASDRFDDTQDNNDGFFLLEQLTQGEADFRAMLHVWKEITDSADGSKSAVLSVEVSWPYEMPYDSRQKQSFSLEVFNEADVAFADADYSYCLVTRDHTGGYSTNVAATYVSENEDGTFDIQLIVEHDGCSDSGCEEVTTYVIQSDSSYSNASVSGDGTASATVSAATAGGSIPFDGFMVDGLSGLGYGNSGIFSVNYTIGSLQDQQVALINSSGSKIVSFSSEDFNYVMSCGSGDSGSGTDTYISDIGAGDDGYTVEQDTELCVDACSGGLSASSSSSNGNAKGVLKNDESTSGNLTAVLFKDVGHGTLNLNSDGSFTYTPDTGFNGGDKFIYKAFDGEKLTKATPVTITVVPPTFSITATADSGGSISPSGDTVVNQKW